jgi:hypothetical protein
MAVMAGNGHNASDAGAFYGLAASKKPTPRRSRCRRSLHTRKHLLGKVTIVAFSCLRFDNSFNRVTRDGTAARWRVFTDGSVPY